MKLLLALLLLVGITGDTNEMRWRLSGSTWDVAPSLEQLLIQADEAWPIRHPADGTLGNASHSSRRSDHNPDSNGIVRAGDIGEVTEDDAFALAEALRISRDPRIKYVIHERRMYSSYPKGDVPAYTWRHYSGTNGHWSHVHISVLETNQNNTSPWDIGEAGPNIMLVIDIQIALNKAGITDFDGEALEEDGEYGPRTAAALVKGFSRIPNIHTHTATTTIN